MKAKTMMKTIALTALALAAGCRCGESCSRSEIRLMSYNVHHCEGADGKIDYGRIADNILRERPDFAGLQELDRMAERSGKMDQPAELGRLTGMHATYAKAIPLQGGSYGVALLSREKPLSVVRVPLPGKEPRVLLLCEFEDCWAGTTHLSLQSENRLKSAKIIRDVLNSKTSGKPVFLTGDWNAKPGSDELSEFRGYLRILSPEKSITYHGFKKPAPGSEYCIDYIAVDSCSASRFSVRDASVGDDMISSDHNPVVVSVEVR